MASTAGVINRKTEMTTDSGQPQIPDAGWTPDWQLFETPESRRLDFQIKIASVAELVLLTAFCLQLATELIVKTGFWTLLVLPVAFVLTFSTGPPRRHPLTGLVRAGIGIALESNTLTVIAVALFVAEYADYFLLPRLLAAGRGGMLPSGHEARAARTSGLRRLKSARLGRALAAMNAARVNRDASR
jgi:hypothetical protein